MIALAPIFEGGVKDTVAVLSPTTVLTFVGAAGNPVNEDGLPIPYRLAAVVGRLLVKE